MTLVSGARATQNKHLSDDMSALLKLGGVSWLLRQAILLATISLHTVQTKTETERNTSTTSTTTSTGTSTSSNSTITIQNVANGGLKGTTEIRHLDWEWREHRDYVWGKVRGRCGFKPTQDVADERLRVGWLDETLLGECIQEDVVAVDDSWHSTMIWGFQYVNGARRYVRRVTFRKNKNNDGDNGDDDDSTTVSVRLVYDFRGPTTHTT